MLILLPLGLDKNLDLCSLCLLLPVKLIRPANKYCLENLPVLLFPIYLCVIRVAKTCLKLYNYLPEAKKPDPSSPRY